MKRLPIILAGLAAALLVLCTLEYGARGLNPEVDSDWVLHPAWWQSDSLADGGFYLRVWAVLVCSCFERFLGTSFPAFFLCCLLVQFLLVVVLALVVFYVTKWLLRSSGFRTRSGEPPSR